MRKSLPPAFVPFWHRIHAEIQNAVVCVVFAGHELVKVGVLAPVWVYLLPKFSCDCTVLDIRLGCQATNFFAAVGDVAAILYRHCLDRGCVADLFDDGLDGLCAQKRRWCCVRVPMKFLGKRLITLWTLNGRFRECCAVRRNCIGNALVWVAKRFNSSTAAKTVPP